MSAIQLAVQIPVQSTAHSHRETTLGSTWNMPKGDKLTKKQEAFVTAYLKTLNPTQAYREAYRNQGMSDDACRVEGNKLLKHPTVSLRIAKATKKVEAKDVLTLEKHMTRLDELSRKAETLDQIAAAIKAEELRGKLQRFYVEQVEVGGAGEFKQMTDEELERAIAEEMASLGNITSH